MPSDPADSADGALRFRALVENSLDVTAVLDSDGTILYANPAVTRILGHSVEDIVGDLAIDLVASEDRGRVLTGFEESLGRPGEQVWVRAHMLHADGSRRLMEGIFTNLLHEPGVAGVVGTCRDVTGREEAAEWIRRLSMAVDQSPASTVITDPSGTIEYVNARFTEVTGYTREEALGRKMSLLKSGNTPPEVYKDLWTTIKSGQPWRGELLNCRKDGTLYWDAVWISPIRDEAGRITHFLGLQEDVTERKATLEALRERDQQFRQVTEAIREVYFLVGADLEEVVYVSPGYEEMWGRSRDSLYREPTSFLDPVLEEDRPALLEYVAEIRRGGDPGKLEYRFRRPDGDIRWALVDAGAVRDEDGDIYRMAGVVLDVTERKRAEEALSASERRLRTLFETVDLIVLSLDAEGRVDYVNPFLLELTGYDRDEVVGSDWFRRFIPEEQHGEMGAVFRDLIEHDLHSHHQNTILTRSGEERTISWNNTVLRDEEDRPVGTLSVGEDVTERARLEVQLRQAQKMEAIGRLAGGVAHDFNNLLTAIIGPLELLLLDLDADDPLDADLREIRAAAERGAALTRQLLAFGRRQVLEPRVVDVNALVADIVRLLRRVIGEDVTLRTRPDEGLGPVRVDPVQLEQVLLNLAINARDAMPEGGNLTIETANVEVTRIEESEGGLPPGSWVRISVRDSGAGMDEATRARIFEPFFTTKPKGKGTGLGLSTVYGIVSQSDGHISVETAPGEGTAFEIHLPRLVDSAEPVGEVTGEPISLAGTETVLVVEDDAAVRDVMRRMLETRGYDVLVAGSGREALEVADTHDGPLLLLVTDVVMPEMSGRELAHRLAGSRPEMRTLFVSGYTDEEVAPPGAAEPVAHFLQKPFTPDELALKVRRALDEPDPPVIS